MFNFTFAPSLQGSKEKSVLGLHTCWKRSGSRSEEHPPPPVMVMVAAMLRNPALDAIRLHKAGLPVPKGIGPAQLPKLDALLEADNHEAVAEVPLQPVEVPAWYAPFSNDKEVACKERCVFQLRIARDLVAAAGDRAVRFGSVRSFCALVGRFDELVVDPESMFKLGVSVESPELGWGADTPDVATHPTTEVIRAAARCVVRGTGARGACFVAQRKLRDVRNKYVAATAQAQRGLPVADLRELIHGTSDPSKMQATICDLVRRGKLTGASAIDASIQAQQAGLAAFLFAALAMKDVAFDVVLREARVQEVFRILDNSAASRAGEATPPVFVASAFQPDGKPAVRLAGHEAARDLHMLLSSGRKLNAGASAYHPRDVFKNRWAHVTRGLLDGWDWRHCIAAGGAVVRALVGEDQPELDTAFGDIDLFFYGLGYTQLRARVQELANHVRAKVGAGNYAVLLTTKNVTIVVEGLPRLQVATGVWATVGDVLGTTDVDCCGVGFTGSDVVMTGRAAAAYAIRANVASASRQMVRDSIHFEMRLWKYATRYGFAVVDPINAPTAAALAKRYEELAACFAGLSDTAAQRKAATSLNGLYWLMSVDRGWIKPFLKQDDLSVGTQRKLADVLKVVTAKGYVESDAYTSTHEGGYVVVQEGADPKPERPYGEEPGWSVPRQAYATSFAAYLPFSNHDRVPQCPKRYDLNDWVLAKAMPWRPTPKKEGGVTSRVTQNQPSAAAKRTPSQARARR